jgi:hypothetical protein
MGATSYLTKISRMSLIVSVTIVRFHQQPHSYENNDKGIMIDVRTLDLNHSFSIKKNNHKS